MCFERSRRGIFLRRFVVFVFLAAVLGRAKPAEAADKSLFIDDDIQTLYTSEDGLLSTSSTAIAQTADGFIWIGGYGGLVRYDGRTFVPYGNGSLSNVTALLAGDDGDLWIASADEGLVRCENDELTYLMNGTEGESRSVQCLAKSPSGAVWLGTDDGIGMLDAEGTFRNIDIPELEGRLVTRLLCVSDSEIYCVLRSGKLYRYDGERCEQIDLGAESEQVRIVSTSPTGDFYIGTTDDLVLRCDSDFGRMEEIHTEGLWTINDILCGSRGEIWLCSDSGIGVVQAGELIIQNLVMNNSIDHMMVDEEGNYWFVSSRQGVLKVSESLFGNVSQSAGLEPLVANAAVRLDNRLYVGHDDGLVILDLDSFTPVEDPAFADLASVRIRCLYVDADGNLWFCTKGEGVRCYRRDRTWKTYTSADYPVIASDNFRCITETENGMIAGSDVGAYRIDGDTVENVVKDPDDLGRRVLSIAVDGGTGYFGTDGYGLFVVRDGEVVDHITTENGLNSNVVMKFARSREIDGAFWMVTGNEIAWIDRSAEIHHLEGFPSLNNLDFLILENGEVWIPSGAGIYLATEKLLIDGDMDAIRLYQRSDGLPYDITANSYQCIDGEAVYLCGSGGIISLTPNSEAAQHGDYQLTITDIIEDGRKQHVQGLEGYVIDQNVQRIEIGAYVLTYGMEDPDVFYYLEGFDNGRIVRHLSDINGFSYTNLDGGEYVFHFGIWDEEAGEIRQEVSLNLVKEYKWYETRRLQLGLLAASLALLALLAYLIMQVHARRIQRRMAAEYEQLEKQHLQEIAYKDYLTGLRNRNYLEVWNDRILPEAPYPITFITMDCNGLKRINDNFGHRAGDHLLKKLAELVTEAFRDERFTAFRNGGDEFLVLCTATEEGEAKERVADLRERALECVIGDGPVTFSCGFCTMTEEEFDFDEGLRRSDEEMLKEKALVHERRG